MYNHGNGADPTKPPVQSLSQDLLTDIFLSLVIDERSTLKSNGIKEQYPQAITKDFPHQDAPTTISHVCSEWRRVAKSCPRLWSALEVINGVIFKPGKYRVWLARARGVPIDFTVHIRVWPPPL